MDLALQKADQMGSSDWHYYNFDLAIKNQFWLLPVSIVASGIDTASLVIIEIILVRKGISLDRITKKDNRTFADTKNDTYNTII